MLTYISFDCVLQNECLFYKASGIHFFTWIVDCRPKLYRYFDQKQWLEVCHDF